MVYAAQLFILLLITRIMYVSTSSALNWDQFELSRLAIYNFLMDDMHAAGFSDVQQTLDDATWVSPAIDLDTEFPIHLTAFSTLMQVKTAKLAALVDKLAHPVFSDQVSRITEPGLRKYIPCQFKCPDTVPGIPHKVDLSTVNIHLPPHAPPEDSPAVPDITDALIDLAGGGALYSHAVAVNSAGWGISYPSSAMLGYRSTDLRFTAAYRSVYDQSDVQIILQRGDVDVADFLAVIDTLLASIAPTTSVMISWAGYTASKTCILDRTCHHDIISFVETHAPATTPTLSRSSHHLDPNRFVIGISGGVASVRQFPRFNAPLVLISLARRGTTFHRELLVYAIMTESIFIDMAGISGDRAIHDVHPSAIRDAIAPALEPLVGGSRAIRQAAPQPSLFGDESEVCSALTQPVFEDGRVTGVAWVQVCERHLLKGLESLGGAGPGAYAFMASPSGSVYLHPNLRLCNWTDGEDDGRFTRPYQANPVSLGTLEQSDEIESAVVPILSMIHRNTISYAIVDPFLNNRTLFSDVPSPTLPGHMTWEAVTLDNAASPIIFGIAAVDPAHWRKQLIDVGVAPPSTPVFHTAFMNPGYYGIPHAIVSPQFAMSTEIGSVISTADFFPGVPREHFDSVSSSAKFVYSTQNYTEGGPDTIADFEPTPEFISTVRLAGSANDTITGSLDSEDVNVTSAGLGAGSGIMVVWPGFTFPAMYDSRDRTFFTRSHLFSGVCMSTPSVVYLHRGSQLSTFITQPLYAPGIIPSVWGTFWVEYPTTKVTDHLVSLASPHLPDDGWWMLFDSMGTVLMHSKGYPVGVNPPFVSAFTAKAHIAEVEPALYTVLQKKGIVVERTFIPAGRAERCTLPVISRAVFPEGDFVRVVPSSTWAGAAIVGNLLPDVFIVVATGFASSTSDVDPLVCEPIRPPAGPSYPVPSAVMDVFVDVQHSQSIDSSVAPSITLTTGERTVFSILMVGLVAIGWLSLVNACSRRRYLARPIVVSNES